MENKKPKVLVQGELFQGIPDDFYLPPDYLEIYLEEFEGPLDLLLYIIKKHHFDILNLPIAQITNQYLDYLHAHRQHNQDLSIEYLVMASTLIAIKSRLILPQDPQNEDLEEAHDPRQELQARLEAYARCKELAEYLDHIDRLGRDFENTSSLGTDEPYVIKHLPPTLSELQKIYQKILANQSFCAAHDLEKALMTVDEAILLISGFLKKESLVFTDLIRKNDKIFEKGYAIPWILSAFIGMLELAKQQKIQIYQEIDFDLIYLSWIEEKAQ